MGNKVALIYENNNFTIAVNDTAVDTEKDMALAIDSFKQVIKNNSENVINQVKSWEDVIVLLKGLKDERLVINEEYQNVAFDTMRFFYSTGKLFYMNSQGMTELIGGINLFYLVASMVTKGKVNNANEILDFCKSVLECKIAYGISEEGILVASPAFSYGSAEYNFETGKMHKGTSIEKVSFKEYKDYVMKIIK